ncbi:5'/3'-nucleotidase SurE [candidate division WOR-3 bacterium]|nr:5'/3'-nucleotidase SurE [candidate division WOR-3 bacterium]
MAVILISNDDGIKAEGIKILNDAVKGLGRTIIFAPDSERSGSSHSLTFHTSINVNKIDEDVYSTNGTPTDCILYSVRGILDKKPDIVLAGINHGANLGEDVSYSGTVAIAMEGTLLGIPSVAFSQVGYRESFDREFAKKMVREITHRVIKESLLEGVFLNVNLPPKPNGQIRITKLGNRVYRDKIIKEREDDKEVVYSLGGESPTWIPEEGSDFNAIEEGFVSITPIHMEYTDFKMMKKLTKWEKEYGI